MLVTRYTRTEFPNTKQGRRVALELSERLKTQGAFIGFKETSKMITVEERCTFTLTDEGE